MDELIPKAISEFDLLCQLPFSIASRAVIIFEKAGGKSFFVGILSYEHPTCVGFDHDRGLGGNLRRRGREVYRMNLFAGWPASDC
jgi:hypothetical protein